MAATIIQHKYEKGWHVRINITGLQAYEYGPFHTRKNALGFYESVLEALDAHLSYELRCLSEEVQVAEVEVRKTGPIVGMATAELDVMKAMQRAATTIAENEAECAAGMESFYLEETTHSRA